MMTEVLNTTIREPARPLPQRLKGARWVTTGIVLTVTETGAQEVEGENNERYWIAPKNSDREAQVGDVGQVYEYSGNARGHFAFLREPSSSVTSAPQAVADAPKSEPQEFLSSVQEPEPAIARPVVHVPPLTREEVLEALSPSPARPIVPKEDLHVTQVQPQIQPATSNAGQRPEPAVSPAGRTRHEIMVRMMELQMEMTQCALELLRISPER